MMLWAASYLCFFAFLHVGAITVPNDTTYDPKVHLSVDDIAVNRVQQPTILQITIKQIKTDPFWKGVDLIMGRVTSTLYPWRQSRGTCVLGAPLLAHFSAMQMAGPSLDRT